jgi:predicted aspartyl protease
VRLWLDYDRRYDPPAPVVPVLVSAPGSGRQAAVAALLDSGADCTALPVHLVRALGLPWIDWMQVEGVGARPRRAPVHAVELVVGRRRSLMRVIAIGREPLLGRDWMNGVRALLDGPALALRLDHPNETV